MNRTDHTLLDHGLPKTSRILRRRFRARGPEGAINVPRRGVYVAAPPPDTRARLAMRAVWRVHLPRLIYSAAALGGLVLAGYIGARFAQ